MKGILMMDGTVRIVKEHRKLMKIKARIVAPKTLIHKILARDG
jgi:hypothetical protein